MELLREHPVAAIQVVEETPDFTAAFKAYRTGDVTSGPRKGVATRTREFRNLRGERVRARGGDHARVGRDGLEP
ncbi:MAG TPA: hypothetical protein VMR23_04110 [Candidatus Limnocylindria bacterium]|nr:hypothetical protein [Candidatus Limnocylindria bacterium]